MPPLDWNEIYQKAPWVLVVVLVLKDVFPYLRDRFFPAVLKQRAQENERRWQLSERQVHAQENIGQAMQQMAVLLATMNSQVQVMAGGMARVEVIATEINTRSKSQEAPIPVDLTVRKKAKQQ